MQHIARKKPRRMVSAGFTLIEPFDKLRAQLRVKQGFTLIELLVVIAIISILASLLLPATRSARDRAYIAYCSSSLHQIFIQFRLYANDYEDLIPWPHSWPGMPQPKSQWRDVLDDSMAVVPRCPVGEGTYGINDFGAGQCWGISIPPLPGVFAKGTGTRFSHFESPIGVYLMADNDGSPWIRGRFPIAGFPKGEVTDVVYRHQNGLNMLFADGHVEWLPGPLDGYDPANDDRAVIPWHNTCNNPPGFGP